MRVVAVVVAIAVWSCRAHERAPTDIQRLLTALDINRHSPTAKLVHCAYNLGPGKCASALGAWRAEKAVEAFSGHSDIQFNLTADVEQFPWERYKNVTDDTLYSQLSARTQKLLQYRPLQLTLPGYEFRLKSNKLGKLNVDIYRREASVTSRATKKFRKQFYQLLPFMVVPGLLVYFVLPLILPGLKMMTMASGLVNSLALAGAVYMYLRNHSVSPKQDQKVTVIDVSYGPNGKRVPNHYYSGSSHEYDIVEPNALHDDLSKEYQGDWSNQNLVASASEQSLQFATENSLLSSYLSFQQQPKIRIAYPSMFQEKPASTHTIPNQNQFENFPQLKVPYLQLQQPNIQLPLQQQPNMKLQQPNFPLQHQQRLPNMQLQNSYLQLQHPHQPLQLQQPNLQRPFGIHYPDEPNQQKIGLTYPNNQIQHGVELSFASPTPQPDAISHPTESDIPDIGIDLNQNQLPQIDGLGIENGELQQKMEMSYLKGLQDQQVRIANEQSKPNLDTSYPVDKLGDQIRRSSDADNSSSEEITSSTEDTKYSNENVENIDNSKSNATISS